MNVWVAVVIEGAGLRSMRHEKLEVLSERACQLVSDDIHWRIAPAFNTLSAEEY